MSANLMENGTKLLRTWCSTLPKVDITNSVLAAHWKEERWIKSIHFNGSGDTIELVLPTIISVDQLSVYGAAADLCGEVARDSRGAGKPAAGDNLESMVMPTECPLANLVSQTDAEVKGNLLRENEQKFAEPPEQQKLTKTLLQRWSFE